MKKIFLTSILTLTLGACAQDTTRTTIAQEAAFWERSEATSALYLRGPKAQHQLNKDIASCVSEVKELTRLGTIRKASPPSGIRMHEGLAEDWQSPTQDGPLYTEFRDFHDFESCMNHKGWKRTAYVRPTQIEQAEDNYNTVIMGKTLGLDIKPKNEPAPGHNDFND